MKTLNHILTIIIFIIFFGDSFFITSNQLYAADASTAATYMIKLHYKNSGGEKGVTTFDFAEKSKIAVWELLDHSRSSINFRTYDDNGNLIKKYREFSDSLTSVVEYFYDEKNQLVREVASRSDGKNGEAKYYYDADGRLVKTVCQNFNFWLTGEIKYSYDGRGNKAGAVITREEKKTGEIFYKYDENGLIKSEHWDFNGRWNQTFDFEYQTANNKADGYKTSNAFLNFNSDPVKKEDYNYADKTGGPSFYEYDETGKLVKKKFVRSDGFSTVTHYLYDANKNLLKSYRQYSSGMTAIFDYCFDVKRNLTSRVFNRPDSKSGSEVYLYNEQGKLISADFINFDSWLTGTLKFNHDGNGRLCDGKFMGDRFNADLIFTHDADGNLTRLVWEFSFGTKQTYEFEY